MGRFKRGFEPLAKEAKRQEARRKLMKERFYDFFLAKDGDEAEVRFLMDKPLNVRIHQVKSSNGRFDTFVCSEDKHCPYCAEGDNPALKGAVLLIDRRPYEYTDENGKKRKAKNTVKLYIQGTKIMNQFQRIAERYGVIDRDVTIVRSGTGTSTSYIFERGDKDPITEKEIRQALPDWAKDQYDGTVDSLYDLLEDQLVKMLSTADGDVDDEDYDEEDYASEMEEEDDDEPPRHSRSSKNRNTGARRSKYMDEDEEDDDYDEVEDYDDEEEDEDDEPPRRPVRKSSNKSKSSKSRGRLSRR